MTPRPKANSERTNVFFSPEVMEQLRALAEKKGTSVSGLIRMIVLEFLIKSFNRFLIISLDVLICRYSPLFRAFPALFISEEPHKSFYYPLCFRSQK